MLLNGYFYCNLFANNAYFVLFAKSVTLNGGAFFMKCKEGLEI